MDQEIVSESERSVEPRHSSLRLDITLSVGYTRQRPGITDRWEMHVSTIGLLVAGALICLVVLALVIPKILSLLTGSG